MFIRRCWRWLSDVEVESEFQFERQMFDSNPEQLRSLAAWLLEQEAEEVVMESTAQYWKPVWEVLERYWKPIREQRQGASRKSGTLHFGAGAAQSRAAGTQKGFPGCRTLGEATGGPGTDAELCARCRAHGNVMKSSAAICRSAASAATARAVGPVACDSRLRGGPALFWTAAPQLSTSGFGMRRRE
jgi:hypothetical protein